MKTSNILKYVVAISAIVACLLIGDYAFRAFRYTYMLNHINLDGDYGAFGSNNTEIVYEETFDTYSKTYKILGNHNAKRVDITVLDDEHGETKETFYSLPGCTVSFDSSTNEVSYDTSVEEDIEYVNSFCNELTFENFIRAYRNKSIVRVGFNRYKLVIPKDAMYSGSSRVEFNIDAFGRIRDGIYYKEPIGKWTTFRVGDGVSNLVIPDEVLSFIKKAS